VWISTPQSLMSDDPSGRDELLANSKYENAKESAFWRDGGVDTQNLSEAGWGSSFSSLHLSCHTGGSSASIEHRFQGLLVPKKEKRRLCRYSKNENGVRLGESCPEWLARQESACSRRSLDGIGPSSTCFGGYSRRNPTGIPFPVGHLLGSGPLVIR